MADSLEGVDQIGDRVDDPGGAVGEALDVGLGGDAAEDEEHGRDRVDNARDARFPISDSSDSISVA